MKLYTYYRSSAAYRVRIVLALKGLDFTAVPVHLVRGGGEHLAPEYFRVNPQQLLPTLEADGHFLTQSTAICEYLEETHPEPALLPKDAFARAYLRSLMSLIACEIHSVNNLRLLTYLTKVLGHSEAEKNAWYRHWIADGLAKLEASLAREKLSGRFCLGDAPTLADAFLVPQLFNARRFECPLDAFPLICGIEANAAALPAFSSARPEAQSDAPEAGTA